MPRRSPRILRRGTPVSGMFTECRALPRCAAGCPPRGGPSPRRRLWHSAGGRPPCMPPPPAPPVALSQVGRAAHDVGLAGMLGGTLFGRLALHPSVAAISDPRERG